MFLVVAMWLVSCGNTDEVKVADQKFAGEISQLGELKVTPILDDSKLKQEKNKGPVSGTGQLLVIDSRDSEDAHYVVKFSIEDGGSFQIRTNATLVNDPDRSGKKKLANGLMITFSRSGKDLKLTVESQSGGNFKKKDMTSEIKGLGFDAAKEMAVELDVHGHGHFDIRNAALRIPLRFPTGFLNEIEILNDGLLK